VHEDTDENAENAELTVIVKNKAIQSLKEQSRLPTMVS